MSEQTTEQKILDQQLPNLPEDVQYCKRCVLSNQRPRVQMDEKGVCSACHFSDIKDEKIDWETREQELFELCDEYRRNDGRYDVIVPCSGGKDSSMVAHKLKEKYGMHPLTVTWAPFKYTSIGYENFQSFLDAGFNNLMAWQNGQFHRKLARLSFELLGDAWQPFAFGQVAYAFHIALKFDVKLVFFGENGEAEYSGDPSVYDLRGMPLDKWNEQYFKGTTVDDLVEFGLEHKDYFSEHDYDETDLTFYRPPDVESLQKKNIQFHWFSYYEKWIPQENYYYASEHTDFEANPRGHSEGTYSKYASLDDKMDGFHFYLAFIKFGLGRCTQDAAHEIRDGHITREEGAALVKRYDGEFPSRWFDEFLEYLNIDERQFWEVINSYRSPHVWKVENDEFKLRNTVYDDVKADDYRLDFESGYLESLPEDRPEPRELTERDLVD